MKIIDSLRFVLLILGRSDVFVVGSSPDCACLEAYPDGLVPGEVFITGDDYQYPPNYGL